MVLIVHVISISSILIGSFSFVSEVVVCFEWTASTL